MKQTVKKGLGNVSGLFQRNKGHARLFQKNKGHALLLCRNYALLCVGKWRAHTIALCIAQTSFRLPISLCQLRNCVPVSCSLHFLVSFVSKALPFQRRAFPSHNRLKPCGADPVWEKHRAHLQLWH